MAAYPGVEGVEETLAALREFPRATGRATLRRALVKAANPVAVVARSLAPDDPSTPAPDLKSSIDVATQLTRRHRGAQQNEVEVYVGPTKQAGRAVLNYAAIQEFGSYKQTARPFMRPAWERMKGIVYKILAKELTIEFEKAARRVDKKYIKAFGRMLNR
jgi:HK97 gp10 family phage protein